MLLRRLGNKSKLNKILVPLFPKHDIYFEPFFGTGSVFFAKPLARHNYLNDMDEDVYNVFKIIITKKELLYEVINEMPYHNALNQYLRKNDLLFDNFPKDVLKAARFLYLSNYSYLGMNGCLEFDTCNNKKVLLQNIKKNYDKLNNVQFNNKDFRKFFNDFSFKLKDYPRTFVYADPPYLSTSNNYSNSFTIEDTKDLFEILVNFGKKGSKFMISEFENEDVINIAKSYNLFVTQIKERRTLKSRNIEIVITNYDVNCSLF